MITLPKNLQSEFDKIFNSGNKPKQHPKPLPESKRHPKPTI